MGNFFNNLLTAAAGYASSKEEADAKASLAQITANQAATAQANQAATSAASHQLIAGIDNKTVFAVGAGVLVLGVIAIVIATRK